MFRNGNILNNLLALVWVVLLSACASKTPAPVMDRTPQAAATLPAKPAAIPAKPAEPVVAGSTDAGKSHTVQKGETLYAIAFQNNLDYRELALWNNIDNLNVIKVGAVLRLTAPSNLLATTQPRPSDAVVTPLAVVPLPSAASERAPQNTATLKTEPRAGKLPYTEQTLARLEQEAGAAPLVVPVVPPTPVVAAVPPPAAGAGESIEWAWPVKGNVVTAFTEQNKGIDIAGARGTAIHAAANGSIIHTGAGIRGYGRLVIIKHGTHWVSAYAHNDKITVTEGQQVKQGQKIAEMGNSDTEQVKLHFEIRKQGKPVDPAKLLPAK